MRGFRPQATGFLQIVWQGPGRDIGQLAVRLGRLKDGWLIIPDCPVRPLEGLAFAGLKGDHPLGTIHDLRKTYGTWMADAVPMHVLQRLMGHAGISTTATYYLGLGDGYADRIRDALALETDALVTRRPELRLVGGDSHAA